MTCARCATLIRERDEARAHAVTLLDALRVARAALDTMEPEDFPEVIVIIDAALTATRRE